MPEKPRRSASRASSSVTWRRPGTATRLRAGKASGIGAGSYWDSTRTRRRALQRDAGYAKRAGIPLLLDPGEGRDPSLRGTNRRKMGPGLRRDLKYRN